jgi:Glycine rich protein/Abnormal spindle-like microcephaly-assoc'd, ASPM-SPD-2-Hydin/Protein of unknown function (DUF1573)
MPFTLPLLFRRLPVLTVLLLACVLAAVAISPASASAASQSFGYTGSVQTYTVPAGVNSLQVSATGGSGTGYYHADGGAGGTVNSTIPATPGQTLYIYVGGNGGTPNGYSAGGGYNGGGASGPFAGSGGGATDIRNSSGDLSSRVLVAGGGGGAGPGNGAGQDAPGGAGGYPTGAGGSSSYGSPGGGGTQQSGGAGGPSAGGGYQGGTSGGFGGGGTGAFSGGTGGGGGGGGYYGGGGASGSSGGGGGSDYAAPGAYGTTYSTGGSAGVTITPVSSSIAVTPDSQDFGSVVVGQSSSAQTLTVTNNGSATANISTVALSGANTGSFSISSDTCTGAAVTAGGTCTVNVIFTPTSGASTGNAEQYAELDVTSDAGGYGAALQGQGLIQPVMMAFPSSWDFGTVTDGTTQNAYFRVYNESSTSFAATATITGDTNHEYSVTSGGGYCGYFYVYFQAYGICDFQVSFTPNTADTAENATLTIANMDASVGGSVSISLTGEGQSLPAISVPATPTDFGSVNDGATGTQDVTVTNTGDEALTPGVSTLTGASAARYSIVNDGCNGQSLAKNATCTIALAFSPTAPGAQAATLNIPNNDPTQTGGTTAVSLTGTGVAGTLSVSPSPASFGSVNEGQTATRTFTVSDTGAGTVDISVDSVSGANASEFAISSDTCANTTLTPTGVTSRCTITATYTASSRGAVAAQLGIASDAANATAGSTPVALSGTGLAPADIYTTPANQDFGSVTEGQNSAPATFTVTNTGDQPLNIGAATITGVDATQFVIVPGHDNCSNTAVPGAGTCTMQVEFHPASHGPQGATLTIPSNATSGSPVTISLLGSGLAPGDATVSPSFGSYGAVTAGQTPTAKTFTLTNPGDNALHVGTVTVTGPDAADFSIAGSSDSCSNQTVAGGASCSVTVALTAAGRGARQAALSIPSDAASGSVTTVALAGTVLTPGGAFVDPSGKDFGTLTTGSSSTHTVTLLNSGDETLNVGQLSLTGADAGDFTIVTGQDGCSGDSLAGGTTCTIQARFTPSHTRAETANMSIPSNDPKSPTLVTLTGTGQAPAPNPTPAPPTVTAPTLSGGGLTVQDGTSSSHADVTLQLSAPGTVTATVKRDEHGKWVVVGTQTIAAPKAGAVRLPLGSRAWGHALAPGKYRVTVRATSGGQTSKPLNLPLTVTPANGRRGQPRLLSVTLAPTTLVWTDGQPTPKLWLTFTVSRAAVLQVSMLIKVRGVWQQMALTTTSVQAGPGRVQLVGRWGGLLVPARSIRLVVRARAAGMQSVSKTFNVRVRHGKPAAGRR